MTMPTLEALAVNEYMKERSAIVVPVDNYETPAHGFKEAMDTMFEFAELNSKSYESLSGEINRRTFQFGFRYLNSKDFLSHRRRVDQLLEDCIAMSERDDIKATYKKWSHALRIREDAMMNNIYDYCRNSKFFSGVFLVGAGHAPFIFKNIGKRKNDGKESIDWLWIDS